MGSAEQHRRGPGPSAGRGAERQRPLLLADHRRHGPADGGAAAEAGLRTLPRPGQEPAAAGTGDRPPAVFRAARRQVGRQGLVDPADHVPGPRPQVPRADRRARRRGAGGGAAQCQGLPGAGPGALPDQEGPGLRTGRERRRGTDALAARVRPGHRIAHRRAHPDLDQCVQPHAGRDRHGARRSGGDHCGDERADRTGRVRRTLPGAVLRRRNRRTTRADVGGRSGHGRNAPGGGPVRHVPEPRLRPVVDGLRAAPPRRHPGARPRRGHRGGRTEPPRHVGHVAGRPGARALPGRAPRRFDPGRGTARGDRRRRRSHCGPLS